jgi:hypothetical protein
MTIRFAAAAGRAWGARSGMRCPPPANDNASAFAADDLPREALLHFAEHGLGAAIEARRRAEAAFFAGDRPAYHHWLGICRTFDRRLARALNDSVGGSAR